MDLSSRRNEFGEAICIDGLLGSPFALVLGGSWKNESGKAQKNNLTHVTLYDPINQMWYDQQTIGAEPEPRNSFCAVGAKKPRMGRTKCKSRLHPSLCRITLVAARGGRLLSF